ncbi:hypothetical protein [Rhizobium sp. FKL33]|uniref:hypothetical protein n=1 Tax=Rhizobium sp. FKL33 TaxID=2562307 RepID=UPI0010C021A3|nr:hypothetical protein [Rhizobium sp. FKL33]
MTSGRGRAASLRARLAETAPSPLTVLCGSILFGALMALVATLDLYDRNQFLMPQWPAVLAMFFLGGALGFTPALWLSRLLFGSREAIARTMGATIVIALSTHLAIAALFALEYRFYYAHWHAPAFTLIWGFQFAFTTLSAAYQFTVISFSIYGIPGTAIFLGFGLWFGRASH